MPVDPARSLMPRDGLLPAPPHASLRPWLICLLRLIVLLLFLQKQNLVTSIYLFGLGTLLTGLGLKHMRICSHHDIESALVTSLLLGRPWWSTRKACTCSQKLTNRVVIITSTKLSLASFTTQILTILLSCCMNYCKIIVDTD